MFDNTGAPYIEGVEVRFIADASTRVAALESGDVDIIKAPAFTDVQRLRDHPDFVIDRVPFTGMPFSFVFNTNRWPTTDLNVRKAINLAIDRERINKAAFLGEREALYTTVTPNTAHFWPGAKELIYLDRDEANDILEKAGYVDANGDGIREKDGQPLILDLYVFGGREGNPGVIAAEAIQSDLRSIGVDVTIHVRPWADQSVVAMKSEHNMINFDMPLPTPSILGVMFHSRETPREGHYGMGFSWLHDSNPPLSQKLDRVLDAADNSTKFEERDRLFKEAQQIIGTNYLGVPIAAGFEIYARHKDLKGVRYNNGRHAMFNDARWE
jgi:peptide/nickel transport system substrate-binding protein